MAAPIGEIIAGAVEGTFNSGINLWNTILQQQKFDYDKAIQQTVFQREDTAVQRRMADLEAAGLNPQLAAGSAAGAGSVVSTQAPQIRNVDIGAVLDTATAIEKIKQAKQETENLKKQGRLIDAQRDKTMFDAATSEYNAQYLANENDYLFGEHWSLDNMGYLANRENGKFWQIMDYQLSNQKNSADLLQKQNDWYTANQIINAVGNVLGDVSGLAGGFNSAAKGFQLLRPRFK